MAGVTRVVAAVPLALVPALGAVQGGFKPGAWVWAGALAAWAAALGVVLTNDPGALRCAWPWFVAAGALLLWTLASALWSVNTTQSILEARRMVVYAAVVLALVVLARAGSGRHVALATHLAISGLVLYALARYLIGPRHAQEFEGYLLVDPLGYANAVGILAAMGLVIAVGIAATTPSRRGRAGAAATVPPLALALQLTGSHASWLALGAGLAAAACLEPVPLRLLRTIAALAPPAALLVWLGHHTGLGNAATSPSRQTGVLVALAAAGSAGAAAIAAGSLRATQAAGWRPGGRRLPLVVAACVLVLGAIAVAGLGAREPRASYYRVAWHEYANHPLLGSGAGTFGGYWDARADLVARWGGALDAHSLYLETLAELGPVGLILIAAFLLLPLRRVVAHRRIRYVPAAAGAYIAFLLHAGLDWDWEMPAVTVAGLACGAAVLLGERAPAKPLPRTRRAAALAAAVALGAAAIAGARSHAEPAATTKKAPHGGALSSSVGRGVGYLP